MTANDTAPLRRIPILLSLALIAAYPFFSVPVQASIHTLTPYLGKTIDPRIVTEGAVWLYAAIVLSIALFWEGRTLASIGLGRLRGSSFGFGIAGAIAVMLVAGALAYLVYHVLKQPQHADAQAAALVGTSVVYAVFLALRAGVVEEVLYRGLAIEQLGKLTGSRWLGAIVSTVVFTLVHALHFDWVQLVPIASAAVILAALYMWRHDLWTNIIAHFLVDAVGLVALAMHLNTH